MGMMVLYGISLAPALVWCVCSFRSWIRERRARRRELEGVWVVVVHLPPPDESPVDFWPPDDDDDEGAFLPPRSSGDA